MDTDYSKFGRGRQSGYAIRWLVVFATGIITCTGAVNAWGEQRPNLAGTWIWPALSPDDPRWRIEDLVCEGGCSSVGFKYLEELLRDPQNKDRSLTILDDEMQRYNKAHISSLLTPAAKKKLAEFDPINDPTLDCSPDGDGWRHQILAPLPFQIEQFDDKVIIRYEYWNAVRTVYMDGRAHPSNEAPTRLGHSIGWFDGSTLVVETTGLIPAGVGLPGGGSVPHSSEARAIERFTLSEDGYRLDIEWAVVDPVNFLQPVIGQASVLSSRDTELEQFVCEAITGEF
jgi:hypothetical protein